MKYLVTIIIILTFGCRSDGERKRNAFMKWADSVMTANPIDSNHMYIIFVNRIWVACDSVEHIGDTLIHWSYEWNENKNK